jgi:NAD(P)H dehydrogenase (quinone)
MRNNEMSSQQPTVLVIGATGQTGRLILAEFDRDPGNVRLRLAARKQADIEKMQAAGKDSVHFDLDDPQTFGTALAEVDRLFLLTGYTVDMLVQSKTLVDAARKAGVRHIVHQGIFGEWDCTDPHFAWHQMIEKYIEASGIAWTHLHPNVFMDNLLTFFAPRGGTATVFFGRERVGWIALKDLAAVAAAVLRQGPERHGGQNYWLSPEVLTGPQVADILSDVLETKISCEMQSPDVLAKMFAEIGAMEKKYAEGAVEFVRQVSDGRMGDIGTVRDDGAFVTGRASTTLREWATENRESLLRAVSGG